MLREPADACIPAARIAPSCQASAPRPTHAMEGVCTACASCVPSSPIAAKGTTNKLAACWHAQALIRFLKRAEQLRGQLEPSQWTPALQSVMGYHPAWAQRGARRVSRRVHAGVGEGLHLRRALHLGAAQMRRGQRDEVCRPQPADQLCLGIVQQTCKVASHTFVQRARRGGAQDRGEYTQTAWPLKLSVSKKAPRCMHVSSAVGHGLQRGASSGRALSHSRCKLAQEALVHASHL